MADGTMRFHITLRASDQDLADAIATGTGERLQDIFGPVRERIAESVTRQLLDDAYQAAMRRLYPRHDGRPL